jgi:hypothetical protein
VSDILGASREYWERIDKKLSESPRPPSTGGTPEETTIFIARSPSGGIPAASGSWPAITVGTATCDLAWIDNTTLKPLLDNSSNQITETVCNIASAAVGGSKLLVCAREYFGFKNVVIWELC